MNRNAAIKIRKIRYVVASSERGEGAATSRHEMRWCCRVSAPA